MGMTTVVAVIGVLATLSGLVGVISPDTMKKLGVRFRSPVGIYSAIGIRLIVGALLIWAGPACRPETPWVGWTVRGIGALAVTAAIVLLLLGRARFEALADWSLNQPTFLRGTSLLALLIGLFLIYAAW
jgi:hypothetical protein